MSELPVETPGTSVRVSRSGNMVVAALEKLPAEAIITVVDLVADVIRANKIMESRDQEFEHKFSLLREGNLDRKQRMSMLSDLLLQIEFSEEAQMRLVNSICKIAEGA